MISSEREVSIDDAHEACMRAADHYEKFHRLIEGSEFKQLLAGLAHSRRSFAERLQQEIRAMDHLPSAPDPDREALERLAARFRAALSGEGAEVLLSKCRELEDDLIACADNALQHRLPVSLGALLGELRDDAESARRRMEELAGG